jgi:Replication protein C C-terminal region
VARRRSGRAGQGTLPRPAFPRSQARRLGQIDPEPIAAALVAPGHFGRDVAELLLHVALVDLGRGGEAGAQRMPGELSFALAFGQIAAHAGGERGAFDQSGNVFVGQALGADALAVGEDPSKQRPLRDPPEFEPGLERDDGPGRVGRAAADESLLLESANASWSGFSKAGHRALKLVRERITLCRRDIAKMIATGVEEGVPTRRAGPGPSDWSEVHAIYRGIVDRVPRTATRLALEPIADELGALADEVLNLLEDHVKAQHMASNESQNGRHIQNSNPDPLIDLEPGFQESLGPKSEPQAEPSRPPQQGFPLGMVLDACPDIVDYAKGGISNWRDFLATALVVRSMLGISPSAWEEAQAVMGEIPAAIVVAAILQRGAAIMSAGGYLRELTRKAAVGEFTLGPMLMALIGGRKRDKKRA